MERTTEESILAIIAKHCPDGAPPILPTSKLTDLGIDSLSGIEILFEIEEHFNVTLPERDPNFDTASVQGLLDAVESAVLVKAAVGPVAG